jgi:molybdopterin-guanine dinucleotide biosynthesis protein A
MGRDKASLPFGGETLLARVTRLVSEVVDEVVLVAREGQLLPGGIEAVRDPAEGLGPLAGIAAGLSAIRNERALVVSCDMPLLQPALARRLLELAQGFDACVPRLDGFAVPTCAVYGRSVAARASELVAARRLRTHDLLDCLRTRYVSAAELRDVDPELLSFRDCDTEQELEAALRAAGLATEARRTS